MYQQVKYMLNRKEHLNLHPMKRSTKMKKAIIYTFALSLFALPMSVQANPPAKADAAKSTMTKPLSTMKSTMASPSKTPAVATKAEDAAKSAGKTLEEKAGAAKKMADDAKSAGAKKTAGH
jgi:hypothetical protein